LGLVCLVVLFPVALLGSKRTLDSTFNSPVDWVPETMPERVDWDAFSSRFQLGDVVSFSWPGAVLDSPDLQRAADAIIAREIEHGEGHVLSAVSGTELVHSLTDGPAGLSPRVAGNRLRGTVVGPDGRQSIVIATLSPTGTRQRIDLIPRLKSIIGETVGLPASQIRAIGIPVEGAVIDQAALQTIERFAVPSAIIAVALCWVCLRSLWMTLAIAAVAMIGEGIVLAAVWFTGQPMNAILVVLPSLVFVLTVSAGIHLCNYFNDQLRHEFAGQREAAVRKALRIGLRPCLLASATTVIGLGSLVMVPIVPVRAFGTIAAAGILLTLCLLFLVLPAAMLLSRRQPHAVDDNLDRTTGSASKDHVRVSVRSRIADWFYHLPINHPRTVAVVATLFAAVFVLGLTRLRTTVSVPSLFAAEHPMRKDFDWYQDHIGPAVTGELEIRFDNPEATDPIDRLKLISAMHVDIARQADVSGVLSPGIFLPPVPSRPGFAAIARRSGIRSQIENREDSSPLVKTGFLSHPSDDAEYWRISYRLPLRTDTRYDNQLRKIGALARDRAVGSNLSASVTSTGGIMLIEAAQTNLLSGLLYSFITALIAVALVMMVILRSVLGGLLAMAPNAIPMLVTFGALGLADIPLDIGSVMTASLALGIAVDDTVHLLSRFAGAHRRGQSRENAVLTALRQCGPAMAQTTIVCGCSLLVYGFSDFLPTRRFAVLMLCLLSAALAGDLFVLPAMLTGPWGRLLAKQR
jgi:predicted RND superfamily exporter protein